MEETSEEEKSDENNIEIEEKEKMAKKRIYNPKTRKYYKLRERTTAYGTRGEILGKWSPKKQKKKKKGFFEELFGW